MGRYPSHCRVETERVPAIRSGISLKQSPLLVAPSGNDVLATRRPHVLAGGASARLARLHAFHTRGLRRSRSSAGPWAGIPCCRPPTLSRSIPGGTVGGAPLSSAPMPPGILHKAPFRDNGNSLGGSLVEISQSASRSQYRSSAIEAGLAADDDCRSAVCPLAHEQSPISPQSHRLAPREIQHPDEPGGGTRGRPIISAGILWQPSSMGRSIHRRPWRSQCGLPASCCRAVTSKAGHRARLCP